MFSPPNPIKRFYYRCEKRFQLDELIKLYATYENYAIVLISGKRTEFYHWNSNRTHCLKVITEDIPSQTRRGGQSAQRFERIRDERILWYMRKIIENMTSLYTTDGNFNCLGLVIAGPSEMKSSVISEDLFQKSFSPHLLKSVTIGEITAQSINQTILLCVDVLTNKSVESKAIGEFGDKLNDPTQIDLIVFGMDEILKMYNLGLLKELYLGTETKHKDMILTNPNKTTIHLISDPQFVKTYGELVGIRYYAITDEAIND
jgi:peptide chain release factor subunit 1